MLCFLFYYSGTSFRGEVRGLATRSTAARVYKGYKLCLMQDISISRAIKVPLVMKVIGL